MNKHNEGHTDSPEAGSPVSSTPAEGIDQRRRHFTRAGLFVSGAIMTLKSASVLAGKNGAFKGTPTNIEYRGCQSPSGYASMNVSAPGKTPPSCGGLSPGGWKNWPTNWPDGYDPGQCVDQLGTGNCNDYVPNTGTPFHSGVSDGNRPYPMDFPGFAGTEFDTKSLMEVMRFQGNADPQRLGMHCAASILNVAKGYVPSTVLTIPVILDMWLKTHNGGSYNPLPGVKWNSERVVEYLQSTFGSN